MSLVKLLTVVASLALSVPTSDGAKILGFFPFPSISHQVVFRPLMLELARRGHEVTVITPDPAFPKGGTPANFTEIDVHDASYRIWHEQFVGTPKGHKGNFVKDFNIIFNLNVKIVDVELKDVEVQRLLNDKNQTFDLIFAEAMMRPAVVLSHIYNAPVILMSSYGTFSDNYAVMGAPIHPFLYPFSVSRRLHSTSLWDKIGHLYDYIRIEIIQRNSYVEENRMLRSHFGADLPSIQEMNNNVAMMFLNMYPVFEGNHPVPPSVIHMGGIHQIPDKPLPKDLKSYLDSSKNGVVYVSFGTNVDPTLLPPEKIAMFIRAFSRLPYDVLWKWNKDELPGRTDNIKISKWLPQSDLLKHPKIKAFITQGGLQSTDEAITAGVPLIGIPMFGDQWYNVVKYEKLKIGLKLELDTITEEILENAIHKVIDDDSYRRNIEKLRSVMQDEPMAPLERAVWWTEHVLRHGGARHLRGPAANMSWAEYLELELVLTLLLALIITTATIILLAKYIYDKVLRKYVAIIKIKRA
ncbi:UDP-glucosyltransferase 2 [Spodoptera frugiperda]|uniref:UDP-glucuronosyltransferase n=1 Tax=Spodoptera frugiperda TaxID=7108 RepID=A0A9R0DIH7_SPOFR|nr:UDP-glucosyltransferase 2 [Spodoptera frugiperda]